MADEELCKATETHPLWQDCRQHQQPSTVHVHPDKFSWRYFLDHCGTINYEIRHEMFSRACDEDWAEILAMDDLAQWNARMALKVYMNEKRERELQELLQERGLKVKDLTDEQEKGKRLEN